MSQFDFLIVGAGFSGLVLGERLSNACGAKCLVIDKRGHLGGNAYDETDRAGVLIHRYGPHYFRTNSPKVRTYLSRFTQWHPVAYRILSHTDGKYWNFPINLNTFEQLTGRTSTTAEFEAWLAKARVPIAQPKNSEEVVISQVGWELYEKFFKNYTLKQWQREPRELDASVCGRIPVRTNRDDRYLQEDFQALPQEGYTAMFRAMVRATPGLELELGCDFEQARRKHTWRHLIFTGPIDEFFGFRHGRLPYRSLRFEFQSFGPGELAGREKIAGKKGFWQPAMQVNYPNEEAFTRIVEIKHATGQAVEATTIAREYPQEFGPGNEPYYPIPTEANRALYGKYEEEAAQLGNVSFVGRLATYRYYNMDQVVGMALHEFEKLKARYFPGSATENTGES